MRVFPEPEDEFAAAVYAAKNHRYITDAESILTDYTDDKIRDMWQRTEKILT